jgi:hypothetical protein
MAIQDIVEVAELTPKACVGCGGNIGPFVDVAEIEIPTVNGPIAWHVYLCHRICARSVARVGGYAPGKKMNELSNAAIQLAEAEKEKESLSERLEVATAFIATQNAGLEEKTQKIDFLEGRVKQLQERITAEARANLNLVGDAA